MKTVRQSQRRFDSSRSTPFGRLQTGMAVSAGAASLIVACPATNAFAPPIAATRAATAFDRPDLQLTHAFRWEGVMGTSFELLVANASRESAVACEHAALAEVDRLGAILATRDPSSEISQVMRGESPVRSSELACLLDLYARWGERTNGVIDLNMAEVRALWALAGRTGVEPHGDALRAAHRQPRAWNVDALGKAFVVERAVAAARRFAPSGLLNVGGDIRAWGEVAWPVGVADPSSRSDRTAPIAVVTLRDAALATSGGAMRPLRVGDRLVSHLIDPRTLRALDRIDGSASVVAADCVTANALATAASILGPAESGAMIDARARGALLVVGDQRSASGPFAQSVRGRTETPATTAPASAETWPAGFEVRIGITLKKPEDARRYRRPYVAVWIEDANQKVVRNVAIWGNEQRWHPELTTWFKMNKGLPDAAGRAVSISSATRPAGEHAVTWDGKDDAGNPVPRGTYTVRVEVNREHGRHTRSSTPIVCGDAPAKAAVKATVEADDSTVDYGPKAP